MRNTKQKLAFEMLEKEMEVISHIELKEFKGGSGIYDPLNDCVICAISFATGKSYNEVLNEYGSFMSSKTSTGSSGSWKFDMVVNGANIGNAALFAKHMGLKNVGDTPQGTTGYSVMGDHCVAFLDYGNNSGHAVVITGNKNDFEYYYYDPQNNVTGTISKTSSQLVGTYGYY